MAEDVKYSVNRFPGDGVQTNWEFNLSGGYLSRDHVVAAVEKDGEETVEVPFTWVNNNTIQVTPAVPTGSFLRINRRTPLAAPVVDFSTGSMFSEQAVDANARQAVFIAQEAWDRGDEAIRQYRAELDSKLGSLDGAVELIEQAEDAIVTASEAADRAETLVDTIDAELADKVRATDLAAPSGSGLVGWRRNATSLTRAVTDLLADQPVSVRDFGADRTGVADATAAFQAALDYASTQGFHAVYIPRGTYRLNSGLTIPVGVSMHGQSMAGSQLNYYGTGTAITWDSGRNLSTVADNNHVAFRLADFSVVQKVGTKVGTGILWRHATRSLMERVTCKNFERGVDTSGGSWSSTMRNCWLVLNKYGIYVGCLDESYRFPDDPAFTFGYYSGFNGSLISGCEIQANTVGIYMPYFQNVGSSRYIAHKLTIAECIIEGQRGPGIIWSAHQSGLSVRGNYFELNCQDSTVNVDVDTLALSDDILLYKAAIVQDLPTTDRAMKGIVFTENHFTDHAAGCYAFYFDRTTSTVKLTKNDSYIPGVCARQRSTDFNAGSMILTDNHLGTSALLGAFSTRCVAIGNSGITDTLGASRALVLNGGLTSSGTTALSSVTVKEAVNAAGPCPVTTVDPTTDLANMADGDYFPNQFINGGTGYPTTAGRLTSYKRSGNDYKYSYQTFTDTNGTKFRRVATSATAWGAWQRFAYRGVHVPNAAGSNVTGAEFNALLTSLRNAGALATS